MRSIDWSRPLETLNGKKVIAVKQFKDGTGRRCAIIDNGEGFSTFIYNEIGLCQSMEKQLDYNQHLKSNVEYEWQWFIGYLNGAVEVTCSYRTENEAKELYKDRLLGRCESTKRIRATEIK